MLGEDGHAKLRQSTHLSTLVLQLPAVTEQGEPSVDRDRVLAIITDRGLLTATEGSLDLPRTVLAEATSLPRVAFPARITCAILALVRDRNAAMAQRFDDEVHRLEAMAGGVELLRRTFRLRQEISSATLDLWHVKAVVRTLADGKAKLSGIDLRDEKYMDELLAETESLFESLNRNKEELKSLIELHINFKSFEMNYFLKVLAVISALGLIPAVAGGLLGMNVAGNPWPVTLGQVTFGVTMGMASALYVFAVKGWLK
jgi:Mg2+ and Co2+ transporter CorA